MSRLFSSEMVSAGHPDKVADQVSDLVLTCVLAHDPKGRVAVETLVKDNHIVLAGELTANLPPKFWRSTYQEIRTLVHDIGYTFKDNTGFNNRCKITNMVGQQSPDIAQGVDQASGEIGAGDQGLMFGYATQESPTWMPPAMYLAQLLDDLLGIQRSESDVMRPDRKCQITIEQDNPGDNVVVHTIVVSTQHKPGEFDTAVAEVKDTIDHFTFILKDINRVMIEKFGPYAVQYSVSPKVRILINPTGNFEIGGPVGDCGLTGRKIIVDTYGGAAPHGGGAFSGKDPSKVDRSAAYMARHIAGSIVHSGLAKRCQVQIAYAIGVAEPVSLRVDTFGTTFGQITDELLEKIVKSTFDCRPAAIIDYLGLTEVDYATTAYGGHFGRGSTFPWEQFVNLDIIRD